MWQNALEVINWAGQSFVCKYIIKLKGWKTLDTQNNSLTIDLSEEENLYDH